MAVYFDHKIQCPRAGTNSLIKWHKNFPLLAVASSPETGGGAVNMYQEERRVLNNEGEHLAHSAIERNVQCTALAWHPIKKILATAWQNGEVAIWNEQERESYEAVRMHNVEITVLHWSSNGSRLVSGDSSGMLVVWKADSRGRLQQSPICQQSLGDHFTQIVLKPPPPVDPNNDIASLARAAVSGDESALDMFNWKKSGKNNARMPPSLGPQEATTFFLGGKTGGVYFINDACKVTTAFSADGPVMRLLYYEERNILVTVTASMMLSQHNVSPEGECREILKVKMSGRSQTPDITFAGKGILATATGESIIRMWDIDKEENFVLNLEGQQGYSSGEIITCIAYCNNKGVLSGGTGSGNVAMWKYSALASPKAEPEDKWKLQPPSYLQGSVSKMCWGSSKNLLAVNTVEDVYILNEQVMCSAYRHQMSVVQTGPMQLAVDLFGTNLHHDLKTELQVKGICCTKEAIGILDGKKVVVYDVSGDGAVIRVAGTFTSESPLISIYEQNIYTIEPGKIQVRTFQGTVKQLLSCTEAEGEPVSLEVCGHFLVVATSNSFVKLFDLSRREAKPHSSPKNFADVIPGLGAILSAKCNCNGSRVSIITTKGSGSPDAKIYVWDSELDTVQFFNFETGRGEQDDYVANQVSELDDFSDADRGKAQAARDIAGRSPVTHYWDSHEVKLLVCEAKLLPSDQRPQQQSQSKAVSLTKNTMEVLTELMVVSLFVTPENGILIQDSFAMPRVYNRVIGIDVPYFYFMKKTDEAADPAAKAAEAAAGFQRMSSRRTMRDFLGLENAEKSSYDAMMNFSYYLTIGNMDEAFKSIKLIKSESVWENMAKMCVKTRRLDVASVCLGNMKHARGAKALREAGSHEELDAKVAVLATQLGLEEDAERLLKNCKRYDLLNEFYQCKGDWSKALEIAEMYDRVHLRTTYYNYAKHLESKGDINNAIPNYEKSDTHRFEVPRMLFDEPQALESYIMKTKDKHLRKWWAQYMESTGEMTTAVQYYEAAQDFLSLVRVYCYCGDNEKAAEICNETGDRAACYHLGRQYENEDQIREAVHFFQRARAYGNAIRLCKEHDMENQLMNLALMSNPENMVEAARYYENKADNQDKAVMLYHKAGHFSKALDLAFRTKQFAALQMISEDLDDKTDPELLRKCADFFIENGQHDRAVDLLAIAKKYWEALKLCMEQHVPVNEELVEKLTPGRDMSEGEERNKVLEGIAEVCMQQRQYHLATKKYTQAGNKVKAMKALLKSGDTEKIVFFAGVSRQKEIYVMAANYLQSLDWRKDPEIMKNIIGFYTKGRALDLLAGFYDACGQVEIDEYQNYDKALGALNEAYKCLSKAKMMNTSLQEERMGDLKHRMTIIKKFVQARRSYEEDPEEAIKMCQVLLEESHIDNAVRVGDVFGFMVEHYARREKWKQAYNCIEEMRAKIPKLNLSFYINVKTIETIHRALDIPIKNVGRPPQTNGFQVANGEEEDGEEVEEDVIDDFADQSVC